MRWSERSPGVNMRISFYGAAPATFVEYDPANDVEPVVRMEVEEAQRLMDELWNCGLRPSEGSGSAGALAATQRHLDDMRKLVFKQ